MTASIRLAVDVMGGDLGLRISLPAVSDSLQRHPYLSVCLVGDLAQIETALPTSLRHHSRVTLVHAPETVAMADKPSVALRRKPRSSMRVSLELLQSGEVDGVVSAGNTGALMAIGCVVLGRIDGISRPAICSPVPTRLGHTYLLDLGANVDATAEQLRQFAIMGSAMSTVLDRTEHPAVGILNIGEEDVKGNEQVKMAAELIDADPALNYIGFVEGDTLFDGRSDVVVCDGFVGNVALKVCEGTAAFIGDKIRQQFNRNLFSRLVGWVVSPFLRGLVEEINPQRYNGACLLGLPGVVVKSHGAANVEGFCVALDRAVSLIERDLTGQIQSRLEAGALS